MFKKLYSMVLTALNLKEFSKNKDGKMELTAEQKTTLTNIFGEEFVTKFEASMVESENKDDDGTALLGAIADHQQKATDLATTDLKAQLTDKDGIIKQLQATVNRLSQSPEDDPKPEMVAGLSGIRRKADVPSVMKVNLSKPHYAAAMNYLKTGIFAEGSTIDVGDLREEFGTYLNTQANLEVFTQIFQGFDTAQYMTAKMATTEWRASQALITSVVQQFSNKWTPSGKAQFKPLVIKNRRHKINYPIIPSEVLDSYLLGLYDEGLAPDQMPITRWIIENLLLPQILQDIELRMIAKGKFVDRGGNESNGDPGTAAEDSMDGFENILVDAKAAIGSADDTHINFFEEGNDFDPFAAGTTDQDILDYVEGFVDWINPLYANSANMRVYCSREFYKRYKRAYKKVWGVGSSEAANSQFGGDVIDFSTNVLTVLPSMYGSPILFATPQQNFIKLRHKNQVPNIVSDIQKENYEVKIFGEFWLGAGFAIGEAVFASVPDGYDPKASIVTRWGAHTDYQQYKTNAPAGSGVQSGI